ncbi:MAG: helix-turn-helix domain-containing protein [Gammaproteobacteria bacterium]|nr:transposase [Pseudomonadales bacterium]MCP5347621.1 transposase [Pseudomonadales bacterium]
MARPLRIEYPDAVYHVSNYGLEGQRVFPSDRYFEAFLAGLEETCSRLNVQVLAYCLLRDQYHLIIRTPEANLSRFMRQVDGLYTQQYQRLKKAEGSLFRGRYKAVLVQADKYLLPLSRYVHSLARSGDIKTYSWSSYAAYVDKNNPPVWLDRETALRQLPVTAAKRRAAYDAYVAEGVDEEMSQFYGKKNLASIMGDDKFRKQAQRKRATTRVRGVSRGANAKWRPSCKDIVSEVAKQFKVSEESIYKAARGPGSKNVPRWVAMYLCQELSAVTLQAIARLFKLKRYGTVSTTVGKLKKEFAEDPRLQASTDRLARRLAKGK